MKVLVTGAAGFLGAAIVRSASQASLEVLPTTRHPTNVHGIGTLACDLSDPRALLALLDRQAPEVVVNCAAVVDFGSGSLARQYGVNALVPALIAGWAATSGTHLVHASSTIVHGSQAQWIDDSTPVDADTDYGRSKLLAETMISASCCQSCIIRIGGIFGTDGPDHLTLNKAIRGARAGVVPKVFGLGAAVRNYVHVSDAATAMLAAAQERLTGVHRLAGRDTLSIAEMLQGVCDVFLPGCTPEFVGGSEARDQVVVPSRRLPAGRGFVEALKEDV